MSLSSRTYIGPGLGWLSHRLWILVTCGHNDRGMGRRVWRPGYHCLVVALRNDGLAAWASR